jgi:hypothetical protein
MDLVERSYQVQLMGDIYRLAVRVIAWVGPEADDSLYALKTLEQIGTGYEVDWHRLSDLTIKPALGNKNAKVGPDLRYIHRYAMTNRQQLAVRSLVLRSWFERLWVQQEIKLADAHAIILCGSVQLSWDIFRRFYFVLLLFSSESHLAPFTWYQQYTYSARMLTIKELCKPIFGSTFHYRVRSVQHSKCSDPRDRVYALLSIHEQGRRPNEMKLEICPNYNAPVSQVYQQVACENINHNQSLEILESCELRPENPHNLPSWVPDMSRPRLANAINGDYTAGRTFPVWDCCAGGILHARGRSICSLQTTDSFSFSSVQPTTQEIYETLLRLRPLINIEDAYVAGGSLRNAYCDALSAGSFILKIDRDSCKQLLEIIWNTDLGATSAGFRLASYRPFFPNPVPSIDDILRHIFTYCNNRTLCTTEQGYIVPAPKYAKPGDQVCVLLGCHGNMLLRPAGTQSKVVGECYVPGLESEEALAGPLPQGYRKKMVFDENRGCESQGYWSPKFQNITNNEIISEDPRFDSSEYAEIGSIVPFQLCRGEKKVQMGNVRVSDLDDEARLAYLWREENLKKRGVELQYFYLI